jgi:predicted Zn-dependent protease
VLTACATNPATGEKEISLMSEAREIALGQQIDTEVRREMGVYNDPTLGLRSRIGLHVIDSPARLWSS